MTGRCLPYKNRENLEKIVIFFAHKCKLFTFLTEI